MLQRSDGVSTVGTWIPVTGTLIASRFLSFGEGTYKHLDLIASGKPKCKRDDSKLVLCKHMSFSHQLNPGKKILKSTLWAWEGDKLLYKDIRLQSVTCIYSLSLRHLSQAQALHQESDVAFTYSTLTALFCWVWQHWSLEKQNSTWVFRSPQFRRALYFRLLRETQPLWANTKGIVASPVCTHSSPPRAQVLSHPACTSLLPAVTT